MENLTPPNKNTLAKKISNSRVARSAGALVAGAALSLTGAHAANAEPQSTAPIETTALSGQAIQPNAETSVIPDSTKESVPSGETVTPVDGNGNPINEVTSTTNEVTTTTSPKVTTTTDNGIPTEVIPGDPTPTTTYDDTKGISGETTTTSLNSVSNSGEKPVIDIGTAASLQLRDTNVSEQSPLPYTGSNTPIEVAVGVGLAAAGAATIKRYGQGQEQVLGIGNNNPSGE